jgi:hypothetical protein
LVPAGCASFGLSLAFPFVFCVMILAIRLENCCDFINYVLLFKNFRVKNSGVELKF